VIKVYITKKKYRFWYPPSEYYL